MKLYWKTFHEFALAAVIIVVVVPLQAARALSSSAISKHTTTGAGLKLEQKQPQRIPWLIVGGGIHGVHIATRLLGEAKLGKEDVLIVDEGDTLLSSWKLRTAATGMEYLRSSAGFHLDLSVGSLRNFGKKTTTKYASVLFSNDYERPRLDVFNQHCDFIIDEYQLSQRHLQGRVTHLELKQDCVHVSIDMKSANGMEKADSYVIEAKEVVLALGNDKPAFPTWATQELVDQGLIQHLLDTKTTTEPIWSMHPKSIAIIGGGITAAHKALQLANNYPTQTHVNHDKPVVHMISRHPLKEQQFDTHQDWMMDAAAVERSEVAGGSGLPKRQQLFQLTSCLQKRREIIQKERIPGTITAAVNRGRDGLCYAIQKGKIQWHQAEVTRLVANKNQHDQRCTLELSCGETIQVDQVLLATGFGKRPPSLDLIANLGLPVSPVCGYPIVDFNLRWGHDRLFVSGALAELELGPSARNIAGARLAAERILQAATTNV